MGFRTFSAKISIINILFGSQWLESILIFKCLVIRGVTSTHYSLVKSAILAKRKIREGYIYDNLKRLVELSSLIGLILGGFNLFLLWLVCAQVVILIIQCVMIHRAMGYAYYELLNFMMVNLVVFSCGSIYIDFAIDCLESIIIQDCIRGLSVFTMIVLKFMIFDRKLLNEVRKTAMNILIIGR